MHVVGNSGDSSYLLSSLMVFHDVIQPVYTACYLVCIKLEHTTHKQLLNCYVKKRQTLLPPTYGLKLLTSGEKGFEHSVCLC